MRLASEAKARHLCIWPATELDSLIPTLEAWGLVGSSDDFVGQFQLDGTSAYFEVVILDDEDAL